MAKSALNKDPKVESDSKIAKAKEIYNRGIRMLKKYPPGHPRRAIGERLINQAGPRTGIADWNKALKTPARKGAKPPSAEKKFADMTPEKQRDVLTDETGFMARENINRAQAFDPNKPFQGYEMGFGQARDKAYSDVMNQFERSMQPEFERQQKEFQQRMYEQGIDPQSGAYQAQAKALNDAQNNARLNAQSQASQQAYEVQQQAFNQGQASANMPWQWQQIAQPFVMTPWEQAGNVDLANIQGQFGLEQAQLQGKSAREIAALNAATSRANTQAQIEAENERWRRENMNQYPPSNQGNRPGFPEGAQSSLPNGVISGGINGGR